jgi:molybdopterin/thiamine biosynthesis adenylyltransferase
MSKTVVIVGVGALGSHLVLLARNWEHQLRLIDFDRVEQKNTQAQLHTRMSLGRNKAQALQQAMQGLFGLKVESIPRRLAGDNAEQLLGDAALVIDCTDNAEARRLIQGFVRAHDLPCLHGALSADGTFARVIWDEHFVEDEEGEPGQATCEDGARLPFFALAAATLALAAQSFLEDGSRASYQLMPGSLVRLA